MIETDRASIAAIAEKIFSHAAFTGIDVATLRDRYDPSTFIARVKATARPTCAPRSQTDTTVASIPGEGIVIDAPGTYTFAADLTWTPAEGAAAAITITASDVTLDLGGHSLSAFIGDDSQCLSGVQIQNAARVVVRNGTLLDMSFYGIQAESVAGLVLSDLLISGMVFTNLALRFASPAGIHVDHATDVLVERCGVSYLYVTSDSSAGIQLMHTIGAVVRDCTISNLENFDGAVQGYSYIGCIDVTTTRCRADTFKSHFGGNIRTSGHTVLGFIPIFCSGLAFTDCVATRMTGCSDDCHGMSVFLNEGVVVENFEASYVTDGVTPTHTGAKATGLEVYGVNVVVRDAKVRHIVAINPQDRQSTGFSAWGAAITFERCTAEHVVVRDEAGRSDPSLGYGTGFGWAPDPRPEFRAIGAYLVRYEHCRATDCAVGFDTWFHVDSVWHEPETIACPIAILVEPSGTRVLSGDPASECNPPITVTITNIASGNRYPVT